MVGQVYYYQIKIFLTSTGEYNGVSRIKYGLSMAPLAENISDSRTLGDRQVKTSVKYLLVCSQLAALLSRFVCHDLLLSVQSICVFQVSLYNQMHCPVQPYCTCFTQASQQITQLNLASICADPQSAFPSWGHWTDYNCCLHNGHECSYLPRGSMAKALHYGGKPEHPYRLG